MKSIFEKIMERELPAKIVYEDDEIIAIEDIAPKAPVHLLIIPKKKIEGVQMMNEEDFYLLGKIVAVAQKLAVEKGIEKGYRLITNNGPLAGQSVFHLHFHLLGGRELKDLG